MIGFLDIFTFIIFAVMLAVAAAVAIPVAAQHLMVLCGAEHLVRHEALVLGQTGRVHGETDPNAMIGMMIAAAVLPGQLWWGGG